MHACRHLQICKNACRLCANTAVWTGLADLHRFRLYIFGRQHRPPCMLMFWQEVPSRVNFGYMFSLGIGPDESLALVLSFLACSLLHKFL